MVKQIRGLDRLVPIVTIDGPGGSGKGTVSQSLAHQLGWHFLDSGALYRALAIVVSQRKIDLSDTNALRALAISLDVRFVVASMEQPQKILVENTDVSSLIRTPECGSKASFLAAIPEVRAGLLERQRAFCEMPGLIADGRDMGSVIFPEAMLKVFLEASKEARALRRQTQLQAQGIDVSLERVLSELVERDKRDAERSVAPLKPAADAWFLDTTNLSVDEVHAKIMHKLKQCLSSVGGR